MRFFTKAWHGGELSDEESDAADAAYRSHLAALEPTLPMSLRQLARATNLHDAQFHCVTLDRKSARLVLQLIAGDNRGHFDVVLDYRGVDCKTQDSALLRQIATVADIELLYDELDQSGLGQYRHSILFWPYHELDVTFAELALSVSPRPGFRPMGVGGSYSEGSLPAAS